LAHQKKLSKSQRRKTAKLEENQRNFHRKFNLAKFNPLTENQSIALKEWLNEQNLVLHGTAGTGKTYMAMHFALKEVLNQTKSYEKVVIIRSTVSSREQGFMPGSLQQKQALYEAPYIGISTELFPDTQSTYATLKSFNILEFESTSYLRGITLNNSVIIVDEIQNMTDQELHTIMTRVGSNSKLIFVGDIKQNDLQTNNSRQQSGIRKFLKILNRMSEFSLIEFDYNDIVRSDLIRSYIIERELYENREND